MHKTDLITEISNISGLTKEASNAALGATFSAITKALKKKDSITLIGFGTFKTIKTKARKGRNPQTGKEIQIKAATRVKFSAGKGLKDSVNNSASTSNKKKG